MSDENKEATINQKAQLSDEALDKVVAGFESQEHGVATPTTSYFQFTFTNVYVTSYSLGG